MKRLPRISCRYCVGVTLLDVALALVIASLLLVGVLRGSELIAGAQTKRIGLDVSHVTAAFLTYQDRYRSIAGDDASAAARWPGAKSGNGDGVLSGHYDDPPPIEVSALVVDQTQGESLNFWWHLRLAGLVTGPQSGAGAATPPTHALGGRMGSQQGAFGLRGLVLCLDGIEQQIASALDRQIDDGQPGSGSLRAGTVDGSLPAYQLAGSALTVCVSLDGARGGGPDQLYPLLGAPNAPANGAPQSVAPGVNGNGQRNGQNGSGPGNNGNGNGNNANPANG